jgi:alkanesulfonate monooxygenase SsuD/methylene tetrahydromethanopterin reductase-like flavin-dependent oxidoreductase (luciferase family)
MAFFGLRFDFRMPADAPGTRAERYAAALEMAQWADGLGCVPVITLSEHHGSDDGYLPSPLPVAAAMAARTTNVRFNIAAMIPCFHDPLRLAEDIAVVDLLSNGRIDLVLANGYVAREFDMFDVPLSERPKRTTEMVRVLKQAWTGEPFEYQGRTVQVRPTPATPGGPAISLGGSTEKAARRAARIADGFLPSTGEVWEFYADELAKLGKPDPGPWPGGDTTVVHVAEDHDQGWAELAPYAMHETNAYGAWQVDAGLGTSGGYQPFTDPEVLRASGAYRVVTPDEMVAELGEKGPFAFTMLHPLVGGLPPEIGWKSLRLVEHEVVPRL